MSNSYTSVDSSGAILKVFRGVPANFIEANVSDRDIILNVEPPTNRASYWDFSMKSWIDIGNPPTPDHTFDYGIKAWVDLRTLDEIKAHKWAEIKTQRDQLEFGAFEFEGNTYNSDQTSQGRIMGAVLAGAEQVWTTADNSTVTLTGPELLELYQALQAHIASVHERGRVARESINAATTKEEVEEIQL